MNANQLLKQQGTVQQFSSQNMNKVTLGQSQRVDQSIDLMDTSSRVEENSVANTSMRKKRFAKYSPSYPTVDNFDAIKTSGNINGQFNANRDKKILDTLHILTLPSMKSSQTDNRFGTADKKSREMEMCESSKSSHDPRSFMSEEENIIFYHPKKTKEVSLDDLKRKRPSYQRLRFGKKPRRMSKGFLEKQLEDYEVKINDLKISEDEICISPEVLSQIIKILQRKTSRKNSLSDSMKIEQNQSYNVLQPQPEPEGLKRITQNSFQNDNHSKIDQLCGNCGAQMNQNGNKNEKAANIKEKYKKLSELITKLKEQYRQIGENFLLLREEFEDKVNALQAKLKRQNMEHEFNLEHLRQIERRCDSIKKQYPSQMSAECLQLVKNWENDLENDQDDLSQISFWKNDPLRNQKQKNGNVFAKKESINKNDISVFSIRSAGKIVKNVRCIKNKSPQEEKYFHANEFQFLEKYPPLDKLQFSQRNQGGNAIVNSKSPQSPPTKEPRLNTILREKKRNSLAHSQSVGQFMADQRVRRKEQDSLCSSRISKKQSRDCYDNIQKALSRLKETFPDQLQSKVN